MAKQFDPNNAQNLVEVRARNVNMNVRWLMREPCIPATN